LDPFFHAIFTKYGEIIVHLALLKLLNAHFKFLLDFTDTLTTSCLLSDDLNRDNLGLRETFSKQSYKFTSCRFHGQFTIKSSDHQSMLGEVGVEVLVRFGEVEFRGHGLRQTEGKVVQDVHSIEESEDERQVD
jgi:hypothetical protein